MTRSIYTRLLVAVCAAGLMFGCGKQQNKAANSSAQSKDTLHVADTTLHAADSTQHPADTAQAAVDTVVKQPIDSLYFASTLSYEQRQGKVIYTKYCNVCHGEQGKGDGFNSYNLDPKPGDLSDAHTMSALSDERIIQSIREGGAGVNKSPLMPSWGGRLNKDEIGYVVAYIHTFAQDTTSKAQ
ncbi:MAG TPA: c-type cytochrome [Candidatus Kapabacteria bacterium]|nr:c-type cytochrome [Candidatus Kapabacteria bacterium]